MAYGEVPNNEVTATRANSISLSKDHHDQGRYYNSNYAIENFINKYTSDTDPFAVLNDFTVLGFKLFFHFDADSGLLADESKQNSALAFFNRTGQTARFKLLERFINVLSRVNTLTPWIFQSIDGLEDLYNTPFSEIYTKKQLIINTLETIDGKISSIAQMYRNIAYDYERHVEVLPKNLRRLSLSIYLYDFRNFDNLSQTAVDLLQTIENQDVKNLNHILFDIGYAEFDVTSGSGAVASAKNDAPEIATNNLKINYEKFAVSSLFKSITGATELEAGQFSLPQVGSTNTTNLAPDTNISAARSRVSEAANALLDVDSWKTKIKNIASDVQRRLTDRIRSELTKLYLGNVNGFGREDLTRYSKDPDYRKQFLNIYSSVSGIRSLKNAVKDVEPGDLGNAHS